MAEEVLHERLTVEIAKTLKDDLTKQASMHPLGSVPVKHMVAMNLAIGMRVTELLRSGELEKMDPTVLKAGLLSLIV